MISGRQTLASIEQALVDEQQKIGKVERQLGNLSEQLLNFDLDDLKDFRELARLRVDLIASNKVEAGMDKAEQLVQSLLEKRKRELSRIDQEITVAEVDSGKLKLQRKEQAEIVANLSNRIDQAEKIIQDQLEKDPAYVQQQKSAIEAERIAAHAENKARQSEEELVQKGNPYQEDSLFMYLWERGYLTTNYKGGRFTRWLDDWVAGLVRYGEARANFSRLKEIPLRLREHADSVQKSADEEYSRLEELDQNAREADGITRLDSDLKAEQKKLDNIDSQVDQHAKMRAELEQQKATLVAGEDQHYLNAVDFLANELKNNDLQLLHDNALHTPFPEDDVIIASLLRRDELRNNLYESRAEFKQVRSRHEARIREFEEVMADFKRQRFDSAETGFADGSAVSLMLTNFLSGILSREEFWRLLEQQRRYRRRSADPSFGSGGFGRGTMWGGGMNFPQSFPNRRKSFPQTRGSSGGGFRFPGNATRKGGSHRSGGFRTGGGF